MAWPGFTLLAAVGVAAMLYQFYVYSTSTSTYSSSTSSTDFPNNTYSWRTDENEFYGHQGGPRRRRRRRRNHENDAVCSICVCNLQNNVNELCCGHAFHNNCIKQWIDENRPREASCPLCRRLICCS